MSTCISSMTIWEEENKRGRNSRFQTCENERSHPQTFTEKQSDAPNSIQYTDWIATRKKSILKTLCGRRKGFQVDNVLSEICPYQTKFWKDEWRRKRNAARWLQVFFKVANSLEKKRDCFAQGLYDGEKRQITVMSSNFRKKEVVLFRKLCRNIEAPAMLGAYYRRCGNEFPIWK